MSDALRVILFCCISDSGVSGVTSDWSSRRIYWTDSDKGVIFYMDYDGDGRGILINEDLSHPRAILADPVHR